MTEQVYKALEHGVTCIDAAYVKHGIACFYLVEGLGEEGGEVAILDTGTCHSIPNLERLLLDRGIDAGQVRYVVPTHVHLDHAGGAGRMMAMFPEATLLIHPRGARHMVDPRRLVEGAKAVYGEALFHEFYGEIQAIDAGRVRAVEDGETFSVAGRSLLIHHTRGHAEHHFCIWDEKSRGWFSGDMFGISYSWCRFSGGDFLLPSTTPTQFDPEAFFESLDLLNSYQPQQMYLAHYGALPYTQEKANLLLEQLDAYCTLARTQGQDPVQLQEALNRLSLNMLRRFSSNGDEAAWRDALAFDMQLNTQGLLAWQAKRSSD